MNAMEENIFTVQGEYSANMLKQVVLGEKVEIEQPSNEAPARPPILCQDVLTELHIQYLRS